MGYKPGDTVEYVDGRKDSSVYEIVESNNNFAVLKNTDGECHPTQTWRIWKTTRSGE